MHFTNTLKFQGNLQRFGWLKSLTLILLGLGTISASGCGGNPRLDGQIAAKPAVADSPAEPGVDEVVAAPGVPLPDEIANPEIEVGPRDDGRVPAKTGLVRGLAQMLNSTPLDDDQKDSIRGQMEEADNILHQVKQQNQEALRQAFRQQRIRSTGSPNIIMIVADDLCLSDLNCYGPSDVLTPNIDRLALAGTRFTQAYAGSPDSRNARWCLVAGRRPDQAAVRNQGAAALQSDDITVAEVMWQAGYTTAVFGHWGVMSPTGPADPDGQGYDEWLGTYGLPDEPQPYPEIAIQNGNQLRLTKNAEGGQGQFVQDFFVGEAVEFLSRNVTRKPVFLQFFFSVPGVRRTIPKLDLYADQPWSDIVKIRAAAITRMDRDIGKLIRRLEDLKQLQNTVFIITSDTPGEPALETQSDSAGKLAFRGHRGELYEGGLRVPLIFSGTAAIPAGATTDAVAAAWDLPATVYQLGSVAKTPQRRQGQSLLPHLKPNATLPERFLRWEQKLGGPAMAVRWKDWKAIRTTGSAQWELYDLKTDPLETHDVAAEQPDVIAEILVKLSPIGGKVAGVATER